jgi:hypothetical protein
MVVRPVIFLIGYIVKLILEVGIGQHIVDDRERVSEPDVVLGHHPIRNIMIRPGALILEVKGFPWGVAQMCRVDFLIHVFV